jgi:phosphinothricin acetyltransferase
MAVEADAGAVRDIYAPTVESSAISFELEVPPAAEMAARIANRLPSYPWLVAEEAGEVVGYAYAGRFAVRAAYAWSVETSVYVAERVRGRGVGRALYVALFDILAAQGFRRAMAGIALPNPASVGLHESMGFTKVGVYEAVGWKLGAWQDVGWWQRCLAALGEGPPAPPVPVTLLAPGVLERAFSAPEGWQHDARG